jgi:hypothetical protein
MTSGDRGAGRRFGSSWDGLGCGSTWDVERSGAGVVA